MSRVLGVRSATVVGLGAMLGTGVFAAWTPALSLAGGWLFAALALACAVAALNAASTATLARALPVAGGVYSFGRQFLGRPAGVLAGYSFVVGKAASAGAAALTIGAYAWPAAQRPVAAAAVLVALAVDLRGVVRSVRVSAVLLVLVIAVLAAVSLGWVVARPEPSSATLPPTTLAGVIGAAAVLFVAFAGYARITILGEEVRDPEATIPRAMTISFVVVLAIYAVVGCVVLTAALSGVALSAASLDSVAVATGLPVLPDAVRVGAVIAAGAALISLIAGVGRTLFAMGAAGDAPRFLATLSPRRVPSRGDIVAAVLALGVVMIGGIGSALALSGATVLVYYAVAHVAVLGRRRAGGAAPLGDLARGGRWWADRESWVALLGLLGCATVIAGLLVALLQG